MNIFCRCTFLLTRSKFWLVYYVYAFFSLLTDTPLLYLLQSRVSLNTVVKGVKCLLLDSRSLRLSNGTQCINKPPFRSLPGPNRFVPWQVNRCHQVPEVDLFLVVRFVHYDWRAVTDEDISGVKGLCVQWSTQGCGTTVSTVTLGTRFMVLLSI